MPTPPLEKRLPFAQWQRVRVTFATADQDTEVVHALRPPTPEHVDYVVLGASAATSIYNDTSATRTAWQPNYILLRSSAVATVDLLLVVSALPASEITVP
jgi:hypothetical protein